MTPEVLALQQFCSVDSLFSPFLSALPLPAPPGSGPSASPLSVPANTSQLCVQTKAVRRSGAGARRRDISRELWGRRLGGAEATV